MFLLRLMEFPVELARVGKTNDLALKVSSLPIFGGVPIIIPEQDIARKGFFDLTYEYSYTIQQLQSELERRGIGDANAYRSLRTKTFATFPPYKKMKTTTFQSYNIPVDMAKNERENGFALTLACTS